MMSRRARIRAPKKVCGSFPHANAQLTVQNLTSDVDFDASWALLSSAINEIHQKNASRLSFEELYRTAYTLVLRKFGKRLYDSVKDEVKQHLTSKVEKTLLPLISDANGSMNNGNELLRLTYNMWTDHCLCMRMVSDILMYLVSSPTP